MTVRPEPLLTNRSIKRRDTAESRDFWDFVELSTRQMRGESHCCDRHPDYAAKTGPPDRVCETCWGLHFTYRRFKALQP